MVICTVDASLAMLVMKGSCNVAEPPNVFSFRSLHFRYVVNIGPSSDPVGPAQPRARAGVIQLTYAPNYLLGGRYKGRLTGKIYRRQAVITQMSLMSSNVSRETCSYQPQKHRWQWQCTAQRMPLILRF